MCVCEKEKEKERESRNERGGNGPRPNENNRKNPLASCLRMVSCKGWIEVKGRILFYFTPSGLCTIDILPAIFFILCMTNGLGWSLFPKMDCQW